MNEPYTITGPDADNAASHVIIVVRAQPYSVVIGTEQQSANEIRDNAAAA